MNFFFQILIFFVYKTINIKVYNDLNLNFLLLFIKIIFTPFQLI